MNARALALPVCALAALVVAGCSGAEAETEVVYAAYDGPPTYPDQRPNFAMPAGDLGITSDNGSDTVTLIDLTSGDILGEAPVGRDPVDNDGPHHIAADRKSGFAYVALAYPAPAIATGPHASHGSSVRSGWVQKLSLTNLMPVGEVRVDPNPGDIVLSQDGKRLVVSHFDLARALNPAATLEEKRSTLAVIDAETLAMTGSPEPRFITTCIAPHGLALSRPDGRFVYAACYGEDEVTVVDLDAADGAVEHIKLGPGAGPPGNPSYGPYAVVLDHSGSKVAVSSTESRDVRFFDTATKTMDATLIPTQGAPYFVAFSPDDKTIYIPTQSPDAIVVANAETGSVIGTHMLAGCVAPHEVAMATDTATLYVVCEGDHVGPGAVLAVDATSFEVRSTWPVGVYPDRILALPPP